MKTTRFALIASLLVIAQCHCLFAQWEHMDGPYGGTVNTLVQSGTSLLAGTSGGGVFRSTDDGNTWTSSSMGLTEGDVRALAVSGSYTFVGTWGGGVHRSSDEGVSWRSANTGMPQYLITSVAALGTTVFAGTCNNGTMRSTDNGATWKSVKGLSTLTTIAFAKQGSTLFVGTDMGVYVSTDDGQSWQESLTVSLTYGLTVLGSSVYACTFNSGVFRSTDNGTTWTGLNNGIPEGTTLTALAANGGDVYVAGTRLDWQTYKIYGGLYCSSDGGSSWTEQNIGLSSLDIKTVIARGSTVFVGTLYGGVFRSTNRGKTWIPVNVDLAASRVDAIAVVGNDVFAASQNTGVNMFREGNTGWETRSTNIEHLHARAVAATNSSMIAYSGSKFYRSTNGGLHWDIVLSRKTTMAVNTIVVRDNNYYISGWGGIYCSKDDGVTWENIKNMGYGEDITSFAISGKYLIAGSDDSGVFRSSDNGATWALSNEGLSFKRVQTVAANSSHLFAGTRPGYVYRSSDNGSTWQMCYSEMGTGDVVAIEVIGTNVFVATTSMGILRSTDNGATWQAISSNLLNDNFRSIAFSKTHIYAGSNGHGVWRRPLSELISSVDQVDSELGDEHLSSAPYQDYDLFGRIVHESHRGVVLRVRTMRDRMVVEKFVKW